MSIGLHTPFLFVFIFFIFLFIYLVFFFLNIEAYYACVQYMYLRILKNIFNSYQVLSCIKFCLFKRVKLIDCQSVI